MKSGFVIALAALAPVSVGASSHNKPYYGIDAQAPSGIITIDQRGETTATVSVNGTFVGYTPTTIRLPSGSSEVVAELVDRSKEETRYIFRMTPSARGVAVESARVEMPETGFPCPEVDEMDRRGARNWISVLGRGRRTISWLQVPGPVRVPKTCPPSAWFGSSPTFREIVIRSNPAGALVTVNGARLGRTPVRARISDEANIVKFSIHKQGYLNTTAQYPLTRLPGGTHVDFSLKAASR